MLSPLKIAAFILGLFGALHVLEFLNTNVFSQLPNPAFPFVSNRTFHGFMAILNFGISVVCGFSKNRRTSIALLGMFVCGAVWYHVTISWAGKGMTCSCTGALGRVLSITPQNEQRIAFGVLSALLACLVLEFILVRFGGSTCKKKRPMEATTLPKLFLFTTITMFAKTATNAQLSFPPMRLEGTILVQELTQRGVVLPMRSSTNSFSVSLEGSRWEIGSTNISSPLAWSVLRFDGTDSFHSMPNGKQPAGQLFIPDPETQLLSVWKGPFFQRLPDDISGIAGLWTIFCSYPASQMNDESAESMQIPSPWVNSRINLFGYGWKWNFTTRDKDALFPSIIAVIREPSYDLELENECKRRGVLFPDRSETVSSYKSAFLMRKEFSAGFKHADAQILTWTNIESASVPLTASVEIFTAPKPHRRYTVHVEKVINKAHFSTTAELNAPKRSVVDWRQESQKDGRVFSYNIYGAAPNEALKLANDTNLVAQRDYVLRNSPKASLSTVSLKHIFSWIVGGSLLLLIWSIAKWLQEKKRGNN